MGNQGNRKWVTKVTGTTYVRMHVPKVCNKIIAYQVKWKAVRLGCVTAHQAWRTKPHDRGAEEELREIHLHCIPRAIGHTD